MFKALFYSLFGAIVIIIVADGVVFQNEMRGQIDTSLMALGKQDLSMKSRRKGLTLYPSEKKVAAYRIDKMLRSTGDVTGIFTYFDGETGVYTMSAQGIDKLQYLVNNYLEGYQPFEVENVMLPLYALSQRKSYLLDSKQYSGREDVWQSSRQAFYYPRGDCEDHAVVLADWLIEMGEDARVVVVDMDGGGHDWVVLFKEGKEFLLEATKKVGLSRNKPYPLAMLYPGYHPKYMFNREHFWENTGSKLTTQYSTDKWQKKSRYNFLPFDSRFGSKEEDIFRRR